MRAPLPWLSPLLAIAAVTAQAPATDAAGARAGALFDGRTLDGWSGDPAVWSARDGCIVGSTVAHPIEHNTYLLWQGADVADFELAFEVRLQGDNNSGVQYRSAAFAGEPFQVQGYQCDVHPEPGYYGMLYEERGRGIVALRGQQVACDRDGVARVLQSAPPPRVDLAQWHAFRVVARGPHLQHFVDGALATEVTDDAASARRAGTFALQVHGGAPMTVWFRALQLRRL